MKISFIQNLIDLCRAEFEHLRKVPFKLCYIGRNKNSNAGDLFNEVIMKYFKLPFIKSRISSANILNIGSLLNFIMTSKRKRHYIKCKKIKIIGTGFMYIPQKDEILLKDIEVLALRGKLSKNILEEKTNTKLTCLLADPGLLASYIFPVEKNIKYKVGVIPHFLQKNNKYFKNIKLEKYSYTFINIEQNIEQLLKQINECECILSSSLHGLIFADSYNIPCIHITIYDNLLGENFKFKDYYSSYKNNIYNYFDIRKKVINDSVVDEIIKNYVSNIDEIKQKQDELIKIYSTLNC